MRYCDLFRKTRMEPFPGLALTMSGLPSPLTSASMKKYLSSLRLLI
jgi:hypothetical protein